MKRNSFALLAYFAASLASPHIAAAVCDREGYAVETDGAQPLYSPHRVKYDVVQLPPGTKFRVGGQQYVMKRVPFTDFKNNGRYALNAPVPVPNEIGGLSFRTYHYKAAPCSDVFIEGEAYGSRLLPVTESRFHSAASSSSGKKSTGLNVSRSLHMELHAQIGETRLMVALDRFSKQEQRSQYDRVDHDLVDNVNWSALRHTVSPELSQMRYLASRVYISKH